MCSDIYDAQTIRLLLIVHAYMDSGLVSQRLYNWAGSIGAFQVMMAKWPDVVPNTASYVVDAIFVVVVVEKAHKIWVCYVWRPISIAVIVRLNLLGSYLYFHLFCHSDCGCHSWNRPSTNCFWWDIWISKTLFKQDLNVCLPACGNINQNCKMSSEN